MRTGVSQKGWAKTSAVIRPKYAMIAWVEERMKEARTLHFKIHVPSLVPMPDEGLGHTEIYRMRQTWLAIRPGVQKLRLHSLSQG